MKSFQILDYGSYLLKSKQIKSFKLDSELILAKVLNKSREELLINLQNKIDFNKISKQTLIINICGKVDIKNKEIKIYPPNPTKANTMNYTTDFIDPKAVVDLHSGALKVAQGMLYANNLKLSNLDYKIILEKNYNALAFKNKKYW